MARTVKALLLSGILVLASSATSGASAQTERAFTAFAEATVFNVQWGIPGFILTDKYVDHGGPTSQALFQRHGVRRANAQSPYIGYQADYPGFPPLVAAALGLPAPPNVPGYPARALADDASQSEQQVGDKAGPYFLRAAVSATTATSQARLGAPEGGDGASPPASRAISEVITDAEKVTVTAITVAQSFSLGPLSIADMRSKSVTTYVQGEPEPVTTTELLVKGGSIGQTTFAFGSGGLKVSENGVPVPAGEGLAKINEGLAPSGLSMHFADAQNLPGGAASATMEIAYRHPVPGGGSGTQGIWRIRFGGAVSSVDLGASDVEESPSLKAPASHSRPILRGRLPIAAA
jgi:hypothetical protein